jgi:DNA-binding NarL/FixJ family response regulator
MQSLLDSPCRKIRVMSVEDHAIFREGLCSIINSQPDMVVVKQVGSGEEAIAEYSAHRPDVTLMDILLPDMAGTDACIAIRREFPYARIIMLTSSDCDGEFRRALSAGTWGYVLKTASKAELLAAIHAAHTGRRYFSEAASARLAEHIGEDALTPREAEVLRRISGGCRNKEIAADLEIAETTVSFHIKNIIGKLGANDRTHAATIAMRRGLVKSLAGSSGALTSV